MDRFRVARWVSFVIGIESWLAAYICLHANGRARRLLLKIRSCDSLQLDEGSPPRQISQACEVRQTTWAIRLSSRWTIWMRMPPRTCSQIMTRSSGESFASSELCSWTSQHSLVSDCLVCDWLRLESALCLRGRGRAAGLLSWVV